MHQLSALIITYNEENNIERALKSVQWADEIVVVDSFSTDKTPQIVSSFKKVKFIQQKFESHARQKNFGLSKLSNDWVLAIDADEEVTLKLQSEIQKILLEDSIPYNSYTILRKNYFMQRKVNFSGWQRDWVVRFFNKKKCKYNDKAVHESIISNGAIGKVKGFLNHFTYSSMEQYMLKFEQYSDWGAQELLKKKKKITKFNLWIKPAFRFFKQYILRLGFLDGKTGFIICKLAAKSVYVKNKKAYNLLNK